MRVFLLLVGLFCFTNSYADNGDGVNRQGLIEISMDKYLAGGILGTFLGYGIGHSAQDRWLSDYGWFYTLSQVAGSVVLGVGLNSYRKCYDYDDEDECRSDAVSILGWGGLVLLSSKTAETITIWLPNRERYRIVAIKPALAFHPVLGKNNLGMQLALSF